MPRKVEGIEAVRGKNKWWVENHTVHKVKAEGPFPNDDQFIVRFIFDVTFRSGPMADKRITLDEAGLYTVKDGKVVHEAFFYSVG